MATCNKSVYDNRTEETRKKIQGNQKAFYINKYYKSCEGAFYWYLNARGYIHIIRPCAVSVNGKKSHYTIKDFLLTPDNMIKESSNIGYYETVEELTQAIEKNLA
jgi:acetylornithine/succinyldiaminopimelate/putrescine aminotransferase